MNLVKTLILEHKADVNARDDNNDTPVHVAAWCGKEEVALALINEFQCDINVKGGLGRSLLHKACNGGNVNLVKTLILEHKADVNARDDTNDTPVHVAALCGKEEVALALINEFQCDTLAVDNNGDTPLHLCAAKGHVKCMSALLSPSAPHMVRNIHGNTPRDVATAECKAMLDDYFSAARELEEDAHITVLESNGQSVSSEHETDQTLSGNKITVFLSG